MEYVFPYLILINAAEALLMLQDKKNAKRRQGRVPEAVLLALALLGGSLGGVLGMMVFRHKTKKAAFSVGMPVMLLVQAGLFLLYQV